VAERSVGVWGISESVPSVFVLVVVSNPANIEPVFNIKIKNKIRKKVKSVFLLDIFEKKSFITIA
jgi:predicted molibdopterin-dependent oxidoreductase YjgC